MYKGGHIINGVYTPQVAEPDTLRTTTTSMYKSSDHDRQRKDFAKEIIQPYTRDGKPNEEFITAYPVEAQQYGFVPTIEQLKEQQ
jgi:hypothetical protein